MQKRETVKKLNLIKKRTKDLLGKSSAPAPSFRSKLVRETDHPPPPFP